MGVVAQGVSLRKKPKPGSEPSKQDQEKPGSDPIKPLAIAGICA